ncbi:Glycosyltransferase family 17 [Azospirillum lipoferum]|nr:Glycosyltransferase family 17 [Azospirillum lipoferum]
MIVEAFAILFENSSDRRGAVEHVAVTAGALGDMIAASGQVEAVVRVHRAHAELRRGEARAVMTLALAHLQAGHLVAAAHLMAQEAEHATGAWRLTVANTARLRFPEMLDAARRALADDRRVAMVAYERLAALATAIGEASGPLAMFATVAAQLAAGTAGHDALIRLEAAAAAHSGHVWLERRVFDRAVDCLNTAFNLRADPNDSAALAAAHLGIAQERLIDSLRALLSAGPGRLPDPARLGMAAGLSELLDRSLALPLNSEVNRTQLWARLSSLESWRRYALVAGRHPDHPPTSDNPALRLRPAPIAPRRRVYDCFPFFNELDLLELRLTELDAVVDRFVLVEADFTYTGHSKPLYFADNRERFAAWADKIVHVVVRDDPGGFTWRRESHQRDAIMRGLEGSRPEDMVLVTDVDEIPRPEVLEILCDGHQDFDQLFTLEFDLYYYRLDLKASENWRAAVATPRHLLAGIGANAARALARQGGGHIIPQAGWHFTWMGGAARFMEKMRAYSHQEQASLFDRGAGEHAARLEKLFASGDWEPADIPGLRTGLQRVPIGDSHPRHVRDQTGHYHRLGWLAS